MTRYTIICTECGRYAVVKPPLSLVCLPCKVGKLSDAEFVALAKKASTPWERDRLMDAKLVYEGKL
jgi:hypothetical protein